MTVPPFQLNSVGSTSTVQSITVEEAVVGRDRECDLVIEAPSVSRRHARVFHEAQGWSIEDLGSTHGTFVEGIRIEPGEPVPVHHEYGIRFGELDFTVALGDGAGFEAPAPATPRRPDPGPSVSREEYLTRGSLLLRLGADDASERELSWQAFHDQYAPIIRGFARNAGCPEPMRDDLVQEVMSAFFTAASRFEYDPSRGRFRGYLKTATVHAAQRMRHKQRGQVSGPMTRSSIRPRRSSPAGHGSGGTRRWCGRSMNSAAPVGSLRRAGMPSNSTECVGCRWPRPRSSSG